MSAPSKAELMSAANPAPPVTWAVSPSGRSARAIARISLDRARRSPRRVASPDSGTATIAAPRPATAGRRDPAAEAISPSSGAWAAMASRSAGLSVPPGRL